jgi:hypothetical protein
MSHSFTFMIETFLLLNLNVNQSFWEMKFQKIRAVSSEIKILPLLLFVQIRSEGNKWWTNQTIDINQMKLIVCRSFQKLNINQKEINITYNQIDLFFDFQTNWNKQIGVLNSFLFQKNIWDCYQSSLLFLSISHNYLLVFCSVDPFFNQTKKSRWDDLVWMIGRELKSHWLSFSTTNQPKNHSSFSNNVTSFVRCIPTKRFHFQQIGMLSIIFQFFSLFFFFQNQSTWVHIKWEQFQSNILFVCENIQMWVFLKCGDLCEWRNLKMNWLDFENKTNLFNKQKTKSTTCLFSKFNE